MDENQRKGLARSLGERIAERPDGEGALKRLRAMDDPGELPSFLATLPLPHSEEVTRELADWLAEDWPSRKGMLVAAAEQSRVERKTPSS